MQRYLLGEICEINPRKKTLDSPEMLISFVPMDAVSTKGAIDTHRTIPAGNVKNYSMFQDGDVLFAKITPCMENGKGGIVSGLLNGYGAGSTEFIVLRPNKEIVTEKWVYLFLSQSRFRQECRSHMTGSAGQKRVPPKYLRKCDIPVPSLQEQARIVSRIEELFSELDNGVETLTKTKQQLIKYRRAVIKDELNHNYGISGKIYTTIGATCNCLDSRRRPVKKSNRNTSDAIYPYYGANGVTGKINDYIFDEDLVLVVEDETFIGRIKPFSYTVSGKCWINNHAHVLTGKEGIMDNKYLNYQLSYYPFLPMVTGTTGRKKLTQKSLLAAPITICEYEHQKTVVAQIEKKLMVCDNIEKTADKALQQAEAMRQSILKKAFEGKL